MEKTPQSQPRPSPERLPTLTIQARRAFAIGIAAAIAASMIAIHMGYLLIQYSYWQMLFVVGVLLLFVGLSVSAVVVSRRGSSTVSGWLVITGIFLTVVVISLFVRNIGAGASIIGLFAILYISIQVLPQRHVQWAAFLGVLALFVSRLVEVFPVFITASDASLERVVQYTVVFALAVLGILIIREFSSLSLTNKLLVMFLVVAISVTYTTNYFNQNRVSLTLTDNAGTMLNRLAQNQAQAIGDILASELNSLTSLSLGSFMQSEVLAANEQYPADRGQILSILSNNDNLWRRALATQNFSAQIIDARINNKISGELKLFTTIFPLNYDMSLTDMYGGLIASTGLMSNYYQGIQFWWQTTYNNGEGKIYISTPVYDSALRQNVVVIAIPVRERNSQKFIGILRTTYSLTGVEELVNNIKLGQTGTANIYFPSGPTQYLLNGQLILADTNFLKQLSANKEKPYAEVKLPGIDSYVSQATIKPATTNQPVEGLGWWLVMQQERTELLAPVTNQTQQAGFLSSIIVGVVAALAIFLAQFLAGPILRLTQTAEQIRSGDLKAHASVETDDEVGDLAQTFNSMTFQLRQILQGLEKRVTERTHELTLAGQVGRALSQERDLDELLKTAVNLIQESFKLYYTQTYLVDPSGRVLILRAGYGAVGAELLRRSHRLPVGAGSLNGQAASDKKPVIVADTAASPSFRPNPLLPNTRSEMVVPLIAGRQLVGVLDLQSDRVGAFSAESLPAFEALAGQMAIAIENAALFQQAQIARAEMEKQARRLTREGWQGFLDAIERREWVGFSYEGEQVVPLQEEKLAASQDNTLNFPLEALGEQVGTLQLERTGQEFWSEDEKELAASIAAQMGRQIDNLRLLAQTEQYRRNAEAAARQLTREGWSEYIHSLDESNIGYVYDRQQVLPVEMVLPAPGDAEIVQPITVRGEKLGEVSLTGIEAENKQSLELVAAVSERLAEHIESLRLSAQTRTALMDTEALYSIIARINSATTYSGVLTAIAESTFLRQADQLVIMGIFDRPLSEAQLPEWIIPVAYRSKEKFELSQRYPFSIYESIPHTIFTEAPAIVRNLESDHRLDQVTQTLFKDTLNSKSSIIVPLVLGNQIIGFFQGYFSELAEIPEREIQRLAAVAGQAAIATQSLLLVEQAQARARQEQRIREATAQVFSAVDVDSIMRKAVEQVGRALGAPAYIYLGQNRAAKDQS